MKIIVLFIFVAFCVVNCAIRSRVTTEENHEEKPEFGKELIKLTRANVSVKQR